VLERLESPQSRSVLSGYRSPRPAFPSVQAIQGQASLLRACGGCIGMHLSAYFGKRVCYHGHMCMCKPLPLSICSWLADNVACVDCAHFNHAHCRQSVTDTFLNSSRVFIVVVICKSSAVDIKELGGGMTLRL